MSQGFASALHLRDQGPVLTLSLGHGATHWITATLYILLPFIREDLGLSYAEAGLFLSIYHASSFAANFGSGIAVDMSGRQVLTLIVALLLGSGAILVFGLSGTYLVLCLMVGLMGAANQAWHPGAFSYLSRRYPTQRGWVLSLHAMGANGGDALAPMVAGTLLLWLNWQNTAVVSAAPALLMALVLAVTLLPSDRRQLEQGGQRMSVRRYFTGYWTLLRSRAVTGLALAAGTRSMAQAGLFAFLPLYIVDVMKESTVFLGAALMTIQIGGMIASPIAGMWSDRIGRRPIALGALAVSSVIIVALTFVGDATIYVGCISFLGFFMYAVRPVIQSWMMDIVPPAFSGSATSLMFGIQSILAASAPVIGGVLADHFGLRAVFYFIAGIMMIANLLVLVIPRGHAR